MTAPVALTGGEALTPEGLRRADVLVMDGRVVEVGDHITADEVIDCRGCWIGPGLVDLHTHLREPGQEHKEDMASGAGAAVAGGYTALLAMPNTSPAIDTGKRALWAIRRASEIAEVEIAVSGAVTAARAGEQLADLEGMLAAGVRWFSDDGDSVRTAGLLRSALHRLLPHGGIVSEHAEDASLTAGAIMHEGEVSRLLGMPGMPASAETLIVARDIMLARETGGRVHVQHISTAGAVALIAGAKAEGLPITAEATPHHLTFDHTELKARNPLFKMKPPLRSSEDVAAVRAALVDGTIDVVATDHAPHARTETVDAGLERGAFGVIGLETAAAAVNTAVRPDAGLFFDRMSVAPARLGGFAEHGHLVAPGSPANLVVFDPRAVWTPTTFRSRSSNSPFAGRPLRGRVVATMRAGTVTYRLGPE